MPATGIPSVCPEGLFDCNDADAGIYPGSTHHQEGVDYDCDGLVSFCAEADARVALSVDKLPGNAALEISFVSVCR